MTMAMLLWAIKSAPDTGPVERLALLGVANNAQDNGWFRTSVDYLTGWTRQNHADTAGALTGLDAGGAVILLRGVADGDADTDGFLLIPGWQDTVGSFLCPHVPRRPIPDATRRAVMERDGHRCVYCGSPNRLAIDHRIPRSRGGGNELSNLQVTCWTCNTLKSDRTDMEFRRLQLVATG